MNNVELAQTLSWQENALFEEREKNDEPAHLSTRQLVHSPTCPLVNLSTRQLTKYCQLFSKKFNTMSALFIHQLLTLPQKIDSREGLFRCQIG